MHNYSPKVSGAGIFMHQQVEAVCEEGIHLDVHYMGNLRDPKDIISAYSNLKKQSQNYDLIHAQFGSACGYIVSRLGNVKILSLRGSDWYGNTSGTTLSRIHSILQKTLTRKCLRKYNGIIVMSHRMKSEVQRFSPQSKIWVLPDGVNLEIFKPLDRTKAREMLKEKSDKTIWVFFPSLLEFNSLKRPELAQEAVREAQKIRPDIKLIIGSGIPHAQMPLYYNASNVVLMTSTHEGWPNSIKEALACNTPFVCTDVSDLKMISSQEETCKVVPADPKIIGKALVDVVNMNKNNNLHRHVEEFDIKKYGKKIFGIYEELLCNDHKIQKGYKDF